MDTEAEIPSACRAGRHVIDCAPIFTVATEPLIASYSGSAFYGCLLCGHQGQLVAEVFSWRRREECGRAVLVAGGGAR